MSQRIARAVTRDIDDTRILAGLPLQERVFRQLWQNQIASRDVQSIQLTGREGTTNSASYSDLVTEEIYLPEHTKSISVNVSRYSNTSANMYDVRVQLKKLPSTTWFLQWSNEDPPLSGDVRDQNQINVVGGASGTGISFDGGGLEADGNYDGDLPGRFQLILQARITDGSSFGHFFMRALLLTQEGYYANNQADL